MLFRTVLEYHAQRQKYAKRFGRELTIQFYVQAQKKRNRREKAGEMAPVELSIGELLELSEIMLSSDTPENPARTRKMIDEAFQLLQKDKVIGFYDKVASTAPSGETTEQEELR